MARRRLIERSRRAGMSMIELLFALSMTSVVFLSLSQMTSSSSDAFETSSARSLLEQDVQRALERAASELTGAASSTFLPDPADDYGTSDLSFRRPASLNGGSVTWSNPSRLVVSYAAGETDDGTDEDGDGLVDEMRLELVINDGEPNERRVELLDNLAELGQGEAANLADDDGDGVIDEPGFCIQRDAGVLLIQITALGRSGDGNVFAVTRQTRTELRN